MGHKQRSGMADIMSYLLAEYRKAMEQQNKQVGPDGDQIDVDEELRKAEDFVKFGKSRFRTNPCSRVSYLQGDVGLVLSSGDEVCLRDDQQDFVPGSTVQESFMPVTGLANMDQAVRQGASSAREDVGTQNLTLPQPSRKVT